MLRIVSFIDSLPRVRGKKRGAKTSAAACVVDEPKKSAKQRFGKISKLGKRRNTVPENQIVKDLEPLVSETHPLCTVNATSWTSIPTVAVTGCYTLPLNRPQIRTNPWCKPKMPFIAGLDLWSNSLPKKAVSDDDDANCDKTLDDSMMMCGSVSSGYGSRDSSPASSVHTPDWQMQMSMVHADEQDSSDVVVECVHCEDVGLQCSMTEDKSVDCTESDFDLDENSSPNEPTNIVLCELNRKISELQVKARRMKRCVELAKEEREKRVRDKQLCQEQLCFIRQLKLAISNGFEVVV